LPDEVTKREAVKEAKQRALAAKLASTKANVSKFLARYR